MKKQYMDFVPAKAQGKTKKVATGTVKSATRKSPGTVRNTTGVVRNTTRVTKATPNAQPRIADKVGFAGEEKLTLGQVEDLSAKFVKSDVPKRPLSQKRHFVADKTGVAVAKAQKVGLKGEDAKGVDQVASRAKQTKKNVYQAPKTPFINQGNVKKRPLSTKNVYPEKKPAPTKEGAKGPVTIITKPEKQAHAGMIIAIILTIILGAAAGTVAFLLLPK